MSCWHPLCRPVSLVVIVSLTGCASSEIKQQPALDFTYPAQWNSKTKAGPESEQSWLAYFADEGLLAWVKSALQNNHDLKLAAIRVERAKAQAKQTRSARMPQLEARFTGSRSRSNLDTAQGPAPIRANTFDGGLGVSWEIDLWGRLKAEDLASLETIFTTQAEWNAARLSLVASVARAWFQAKGAKRQFDLAQKTEASFHNTARLIGQRYESGLSELLDLHLSESNAEAATAQREARHNDYLNKLRILQLLTSNYPDADLALDTVFPTLNTKVPAGLPADLLARRPDIRAASHRYNSLAHRLSARQKDFFPKIRLTADGGARSDEIKNILNPEYAVWNLLGNIVQPIFTAGRIQAQVDEATVDLRQAEIEYAQTLLNAFAEVEAALAGEAFLKNQEQALAVAAERATAAEQLANEQYRSGLIDLFDLLETQRRALSTQSDFIDAQLQRVTNRIDLHLALAGDWQTRPITNKR